MYNDTLKSFLTAKEIELVTKIVLEARKHRVEFEKADDRDLEEIQMKAMRATSLWRKSTPTSTTAFFKQALIEISGTALRILNETE